MIKDFNENKFGMFIHWGVYSQYGLHEQAMARYELNAEEYEKRAMKFNPVSYNPKEWVLMAKSAGMKYICFTAKHHDGFCMWDTKYTDYNIMNTSYAKDVLKMLAEACEKHGMLLSIYYSNPDWHHEHGYNSFASHQWRCKNKKDVDFSEYIKYIKNQITELLTNYGKIYTLFWDIPPKIKDKSVNELVRKLQPEIFINDRGFDEGDFSTPEREMMAIPDYMRFTRMTEACNSVGEQSWGYRENEDYHTVKYLTSSIDKIMAMGGSYLLNVGPKPDGTINETSKEIISKVGNWYNRMNGCLEKTEEEKHEYEIKGLDYKVNKKDGKTYFHFYNGITSSAVTIENVASLPKMVRFMNNSKELDFEFAAMPGIFDMDTGIAKKDCLHIFNIPTEEFLSEPIVIEITW